MKNLNSFFKQNLKWENYFFNNEIENPIKKHESNKLPIRYSRAYEPIKKDKSNKNYVRSIRIV